MSRPRRPKAKSDQWPKPLLSDKERASVPNAHTYSLTHKDCLTKNDATRDEKLVIRQAKKLVEALVDGHYLDESFQNHCDCSCDLCELQKFLRRRR